MEKTINYVKLDEKIKTLKCPLVFLFLIITFKDNISDYTLSIMFRLLFKYHYIHNYIFICGNEFNNYPRTFEYIAKFTYYNDKQLVLSNLINNWIIIYNNDEFTNLKFIDQIEYIKKKYEYFKAIYGCTHNIVPFYYKLHNFFNEDYKYEILQDIENRLVLIVKMFNPNIFKLFNIPLIKVSEFYDFSFEQIIKYLSHIYITFIKLLDDTLKIFILYNDINIEYYYLVNPLLTVIESSEILSDTDIDSFC